jgi:tight adherence protein C
VTPAVAAAAVAAVMAAVAVVELTAARGQAASAWRSGRAAGAVRALVALGRRIGAPAPSVGLAGRIAAAGSPLGMGVGEVAATKAAGGALALVFGGPLAASLPGRLPALAVPALPVLGFLAPDLVLARLARARARAMEEELPDLLDLLRVSVEAGLPVSRALGEVGRGHRGKLAREWAMAAAQMELGVPRARALDEMVSRCPAPGAASLATALQRAERHGAPLSQTLAAQAHAARAARAAPKIQLVVALLLVPLVLLMVAAALVASLAR